jgi:DNA-binding response OmpR family regulator
MPDMDGFTVLKELKKVEPQAKVMMITGRDAKESQVKAKSLGVIDYIVKPLDLKELHSKVEQYILSQK